MTAKAALGSLSQAHADSRYYRGTLISLAVLNGNRKWNLDSTVDERFGESRRRRREWGGTWGTRSWSIATLIDSD